MDDVGTRTLMSDASRGESGADSSGRIPGAHLAVTASRDRRGPPLIEVSGEIDLSNVEFLEGAIDLLTTTRLAEVEALRALAPPDRLIVDLSGVTFMGSVGLAVLVTATERVGTVVLRKPSAAVRRTIELGGLTPLVRIEA